LPPKERGILDDQILEVLRQKFEIKKFLGLNQWDSGSLPMSIGNVPQQYIGGNQMSGEYRYIFILEYFL
jgi:hypothetical protein